MLLSEFRLINLDIASLNQATTGGALHHVCEQDVIDHDGLQQMEVDLLAMVDGDLLIGEVKKRGKVDAGQLRKLAGLFRRLKPRRMLFATWDEEWTEAAREPIESTFAKPILWCREQLVASSKIGLPVHYSRLNEPR